MSAKEHNELTNNRAKTIKAFLYETEHLENMDKDTLNNYFSEAAKIIDSFVYTNQGYVYDKRETIAEYIASGAFPSGKHGKIEPYGAAAVKVNRHDDHDYSITYKNILFSSPIIIFTFDQGSSLIAQISIKKS